MKSLKLILTIALMAFFTGTATAQKNPDKIAKMRTRTMVAELKLDQQQEQKLLTLNKKMMKDRKNLKGKGKSVRDNARKAYEAELKKIFTTDQYNAWKARQGGQ